LSDGARADRLQLAVRVAFVLLALAAVGWDQPSSFSWENDGVAPRDIFAGVAENLRPGHAFRYPLLHPLLLGIACLPVLLPAALRASSWSLPDLRAAVLATPVMSACALIGRGIAIAAAVAALAALGRIAARLGGPRVARWAEAFAVINLSFGYYGRATNLDGPALMWSALAVERLLLASTGGARRDHLAFAAFAAASIATKDQAYAGYLLLVPLLAAARLWAPGWFAPGAWSGRRVAEALALGALVYAAASGALFNPTGLVTRLHTLVGPASGDYRAYTRTGAGLLANLHDIAAAQVGFWWPWPIVALAWAGAALSLAPGGGSGGGARAIYRAIPLVAGLGSLLGFALVVGRAEHRFVLPLGFWLSLYAGVALEAARAWLLPRARAGARAVGLVGLGLIAGGLVGPLALVATQWRDGRRAVEAWLRELPPGTTVETYGPLVYLPRFAAPPAPYQVVRVGPDPVGPRNPLRGMDERNARIGDIPARRPDVVVLTEGFATPYLADAPAVGDTGRILPELWRRERADTATAEVVRAAAAGTLPGYRLGLLAAPELPLGLAPRRIHASTGGRTWVLVRLDAYTSSGKK
jgi:hypothetical protein